MKMKLKEYLTQFDRHTWFYYHLKSDPDYQKEAKQLREKLFIDTPNGKYFPTAIEDFDYLKDPQKDTKLKLIYEFMLRWNIHWDYVLLNYLLDDDISKLPPMFKAGFAVGLGKERNMIEAQIPLSVQHEELEYLWQMIQITKRDAGVDITKKPRKNTFNSTNTGTAYKLWKIKKSHTWTEAVKEINRVSRNQFDDIKAAQRFLRTYGYDPDGGKNRIAKTASE